MTTRAKITAAYFHGFNCPDANSSLKTDIKIDLDLMAKVLKSCKPSSSYLPKGASIYISVHSKNGKPKALQFIAGADRRVFHIRNKNSFFLGWYQITFELSEEWNKELNKLID